jgi:hypothetical protein
MAQCSANCTPLCMNDYCNSCRNRSMATYDKIKFWSPLNNEDPRSVMKSSPITYLFNCDACPHTFSAAPGAPGHLTAKNPQWCPYCAGRELCGDDKCKICFNKSFATHEKAKFWAPSNKIGPHCVYLNARAEYEFDCDKCHHRIKKQPVEINKGRWCSICVGKAICADLACKSCGPKSFGSHPRAKYWVPDDKHESVNNVIKTSQVNHKFKCPTCTKEFIEKINNIVKFNVWCPNCK